MEERLQKLLSACGVGSRRAREEWITNGRVTVNGQVARLGDKADPDRDEQYRSYCEYSGLMEKMR